MSASASSDPRYRAAARNYDRAMKAIAGAHDFLDRTAGEDDDNTFAADQLLAKMRALVFDELRAVGTVSV